jgi:uncharacterized membrane protein YfcA
LIVRAGAAALLGALVQSATGFGFALVLSPALFAVLDPYEAVTTMLLLGPPLNVLVLLDSGAGEARWDRLRPMLAAALPGMALGALALALLSKPVLQVAVGAAVVVAAVWQLRVRPAVARPAPGAAGGGAAPYAAGLASGALTTSISVSGPPIVLWLERLGLGPVEMRASLAGSFLVLNLVGGAVVVLAGGAGAVRPDVVALLLVLVLAGHALGARAFRRLAGPRFSLAALGLVVCAGAASVAAGVAGA